MSNSKLMTEARRLSVMLQDCPVALPYLIVLNRAISQGRGMERAVKDARFYLTLARKYNEARDASIAAMRAADEADRVMSRRQSTATAELMAFYKNEL